MGHKHIKRDTNGVREGFQIIPTFTYGTKIQKDGYKAYTDIGKLFFFFAK